MARSKKHTAAHLRPGTWFALPLPSGCYALGLIARRPAGRSPKPIFCYFFGPRIALLDEIELPIVRKPEQHVFFARTNDRGFKSNRWIVLGHIDPFDFELWRMPPFRSGAVGGGPDYWRRRYLRTYDDELNRTLEQLVLVDRVEDYPQDIDFGHLAMENAIDRVLRGAYKDH